MASDLTVQAMAAAPVIPPEAQPDYENIVTEDDTPVDNMYSEKQQRLLTEPLYSSWPGPGPGRPFLACANVGVFYGMDLPPIVPDAFLSADVQAPADLWPKQNRSYFVWKYAKPPDVVIEVVSNTEGEELGRKLKIYARVGAPYYVVWDPEQLLRQERLYIFALHAGAYQRQAAAWFPSVNLGLTLWKGTYETLPAEWLRWCDSTTNVIPTGAEAKLQAEQELLRARRRAEALAELLRVQGIEPPEL